MTAKIPHFLTLCIGIVVLGTPWRLAAQAQTEEQVYPGQEELPALDEGAAPSPDGGVVVPKTEPPVTPVPEAQPAPASVTTGPPASEPELLVEPEPEPKYGDQPFTFKTGGITWSPFLQARFRQETRLNTYGPAGAITDNQHFVTTRVRFGLGAQWKFVRGMMQIQDVRLFGTQPGSDDGSSFALHQGILELGNERGYVRLGRQEINYGNQRMIGALDWLMSARSFDAARLHGFFGDKLELDLFGSIVARQQTIIIDDTVEPVQVETNNGSYLATSNLSYKHNDKLYLEAYALYRHDRPNDLNSLTVKNDIVSPGLYVTGVPIERLKYTGEFTIQGGKQQNDAFFAFAVSGDLDYTFDAKTKPTLNGGFAYATGASGNGKVDEFNNFYPTNHKFYGAADLFGLRNLIDAHAHVAISAPKAPVGVSLGFYNFALANPSARWSNAGGATFGVNPDNGKRNMGQEIDLIMSWNFLPGVSLAGGWTVFVPNQGAENLGNDEVTQWGFVMLGAQTP
jgi:hypothetical protein